MQRGASKSGARPALKTVNQRSQPAPKQQAHHDEWEEF
jgi:hypothetical protein